MSDTTTPLVAITTLVYNHEPYLRDYFEGILKQKTNFPFIAIVHDDVSTDASAAIIREYAAKRPDIIKPIFEIENKYSLGGGILDDIMLAAVPAGTKYIAQCEGDDFWNDPLKLQKQVDYLESHTDCYMVACDVHFLTNDGEDVERIRFPKNRRISRYEAIRRAGYIYTCGMVYRADLALHFPYSAKVCHVGDYPLQIMAALLGYIYVFGEKMASYRFAMGQSWSATFGARRNVENNLLAWQSELDMLDGMNAFSKGRHAWMFCLRKGAYIHYLTKKHSYMAAEIAAMGRRSLDTHEWGECRSMTSRLWRAATLLLAKHKARLLFYQKYHSCKG